MNLQDVMNINSLLPISNVLFEGEAFIALSSDPWFGIETDILLKKGVAKKGVWIELIYSSSYFDKPVRPILRCVLESEHKDQILPAPVFGRAIWRGYVPVGTISLQISPTNEVGAFSFKIESLRVVSRLEVFARAFIKRPSKAILGVAARVAGYTYLSHVNLRHAIGATPFSHYDAWRKKRYRAFDVAGMDRGGAGRLPFVLKCEPALTDSAWLKDFIARLQTQPYKNWRLCVSAFDLSLLPKDDRVFMSFFPHPTFADAKVTLSHKWEREELEDALFIHVPVGAMLEPYALSVLADVAEKHPEADVFYADMDEISVAGRHENPQFKPDYDPLLFEALDYLGAAVCAREGAMKEGGKRKVCYHVARVVMSVGGCMKIPLIRRCATPSPTRGEGRIAAIIIPTKNQFSIFKRCIDSIKRTTDLTQNELIIVDNGSTEADAIAYLKELEGQGIKVLYRPEPFNFSKLCNDGAACSTKPFLVFLNNDTEIEDADWLNNLLQFAAQPDIGAVGAKLLYANRKLQHGGVILGLDGRAGHFERDLGEHDAGYFGRLNLPHEIAAVTGACLAVEAVKFQAIDGFDAENLPVDLNDIDLCLRLNEKGWKSVFAGNVVLLHHESVSRIGSWTPDKKYATEREYFSKRWIHELRDCPNFHPALTLEGFRAKLG